ncbi:hypothetical protein CXG81DRAFT_4007, partial [Caulochytrium protostelioides]
SPYGLGVPAEWEVLGPFPAAAREAGFDPLAAYAQGSFHVLPPDPDARFPSELVPGGFVVWRHCATNPHVAAAPETAPDWPALQLALGGPGACAHTTYLRGRFTIARAGMYVSRVHGVAHYLLDDRAFLGDVYACAAGMQIRVGLTPSPMDVGTVAALSDMSAAHAALVAPLLSEDDACTPAGHDLRTSVAVLPEDTVLPEIMDAFLISPYLSVSLMNLHPPDLVAQKPHDETVTMGPNDGWIQVSDPVVLVPLRAQIPVLFAVRIAPGQTYPLPPPSPPPSRLTLLVELSSLDHACRWNVTVLDAVPLTRRRWSDVTTSPNDDDEARGSEGDPPGTYLFTYQDFDQLVQYAVVRPPMLPPTTAHMSAGYPRDATVTGSTSSVSARRLPIVVALHGAGVDARSPTWTNSVAALPHAWTLFPTGRTPWGFDWHGASQRSADAAVEVLASRLPGVPDPWRTVLRADPQRLILLGHSNGGHGVWWWLTHFPDRVAAAVPAAAYIKSQLLLTGCGLRLGDAYADTRLRGLMEASIAEHDLDLVVGNAVGVPLLIRTGRDDTNVPAFHSRRLMRLLGEWTGVAPGTPSAPANSSVVQFSEVPDEGHWFDQVFRDAAVQIFLRTHTHPNRPPATIRSTLPPRFILSTMNPGSMGSRGGLRILQLITPFRLGSIEVVRTLIWTMTTRNIRRFHFLPLARPPIGEPAALPTIASWVIDGQRFESGPAYGPSYVRSSTLEEPTPGAVWEPSGDLLWTTRERHPLTYGPMAQMLAHPFRIVLPTLPSVSPTAARQYRRIAARIAQSWYVAARGGTQIVDDVDVRDGLSAQFHLIVLGGPEANRYTAREQKEGALTGMVTFLGSNDDTGSGGCSRAGEDGWSPGFRIGDATFMAPGTGIAFLAASPAKMRLVTYLVGHDAAGLARAAAALPWQTGTMVPDYVVLGPQWGQFGVMDPDVDVDVPHDGAEPPPGPVPHRGAGGLLAAGYWNNRWNFDERSGYL